MKQAHGVWWRTQAEMGKLRIQVKGGMVQWNAVKSIKNGYMAAVYVWNTSGKCRMDFKLWCFGALSLWFFRLGTKNQAMVKKGPVPAADYRK